MAFWTDGALEPTRKYRFAVSTVGYLPKDYWYVKSVDKPTFEVNSNSYQLTNHKFKYPGILTWNDVSLVIVDTGGKAKETLDMAFGLGYSLPDSGTKEEGMAKGGDGGSKPMQLVIEQLDAKGEPLETWTLYGAFINSVDFGKLAYSDDDLVEISLGISYDYAKFS
tara:strand:+ start:276 stop:773 length:498 start_codon:yes stop_codon:yes gene_type:complete